MAKEKEEPTANQKHESEDKKTPDKKPTCGLIMPISAIGNLLENHWREVKNILVSTISELGFEAKLVSEDQDIGVIHNRIVNNIYNSDIVVCDISEKNPNVMFELGLRLAFDKPTILIKDEATSYPFDIGLIEHIPYPRDLRYYGVEKFKADIREKLPATYEKSKSGEGYTTFLGHFKNIKPAKLQDKEVTGIEFVMRQLQDIQSQIRNISLSNSSNDYYKKLITYNQKLNKLKINSSRATDDEVRFRATVRDEFFKFFAENNIPVDNVKQDEVFYSVLNYIFDNIKYTDYDIADIVDVVQRLQRDVYR
ncbi:RNA helicase [Adhaeribacter pallidiroseus]|uniref:RNA helicase n=1 Tax=Adhaeribacter pallidiroseus TaxID=2072847 RepID=A0A369QF27_9BACT|nr:RNA helicase [Adhaeribacter pallidiroseus]RDC63314.1 hypothetical protein AHMF7616_01916 [Adhaeribacter pallidiroseus]